MLMVILLLVLCFQTSAEPKHSYDLDPNCVCSEIKEAKSGGRPIYFFQLEWPSTKEEGDADSG